MKVSFTDGQQKRLKSAIKKRLKGESPDPFKMVILKDKLGEGIEIPVDSSTLSNYNKSLGKKGMAIMVDDAILDHLYDKLHGGPDRVIEVNGSGIGDILKQLLPILIEGLKAFGGPIAKSVGELLAKNINPQPQPPKEGNGLSEKQMKAVVKAVKESGIGAGQIFEAMGGFMPLDDLFKWLFKTLGMLKKSGNGLYQTGMGEYKIGLGIDELGHGLFQTGLGLSRALDESMPAETFTRLLLDNKTGGVLPIIPILAAAIPAIASLIPTIVDIFKPKN